jgi:protein kinase X
VQTCSTCINFLGSFGRVRLAKHKRTGKYVAVKALKKAEIIRIKQVDHVISENNILGAISHPFIASILTSFKTDHKAMLYKPEYCWNL